MSDRGRDPAEWPLGELVRTAITERGWSERETARRAKVSASFIRDLLLGYMRGSPNKPWKPKAPMVQAVARALEISEAEALTLAGYRPEDFITVVDSGGPVVAPEQLARQIKALSPTDRRAIETIVDSLLRERGYVGTDAGDDGDTEMEIRSGPSELTHRGVYAGPDEEVHRDVDEEQHR